MSTRIGFELLDPAVLDRGAPGWTGTLEIADVAGLTEALSTSGAGTVVTTSASITLTADNRGDVISVSASGGNRVVTLPDAAAFGAGNKLIVKKSDTSANTVTVSRAGTATIDGATSRVLRIPNESVALVSTGAIWLVMGNGEIFESGSNANGYYFRFASGLQICFQDFVKTDDAWSTASGSMFVSPLYTWTFPAPFASTASMYPSGQARRNAPIAAGFNLATFTTAELTGYAWSSVSLAATSSKVLHLQCTGRWF